MQPKFKDGDKVNYEESTYIVCGANSIGTDRGFIYEITDGFESTIVYESELTKVTKTRGFEKLSNIIQDIALPKRATAKSAGYDISVIHPLVYKNLSTGKSLQELFDELSSIQKDVVPTNGVVLFPTGLKAYMLDNEVLNIHVRSSMGIKQGIRLAQCTGIIDADYYNNPDNEGHILVPIKCDHLTFTAPTLRIAQGIFQKFLTVDDDNATNNRIGGCGSSGN